MTAIRTSAIADTWNVRDRSERTVELYDICEKRFRQSISMLDKQEDFVDFCMSDIPQVSLMLDVQKKYNALTWTERQGRDDRIPRLSIREDPDAASIELVFHNLPYELMVEHFAGPIHRKYECMWKFVVGSSRITLAADVMVRDYGRSVALDLDCYLSNEEKCVIIEDKENQPYTSYNYRIKCS